MMKNKVSVSHTLLVDAGKSSRLLNMGNKSSQTSFTKRQPLPANLKPEQQQSLEQALALVAEQISHVLEKYPSSKKNTFFKLKYGITVEKLNTLPMKEIFSLLCMDSKKIAHFRLIENYDGRGQLFGR